MKITTLIQGSPEWHAHRASHFNASDTAAMLGCSTYETRTQLIERLATGIANEIDPATQRRFDDGHRFEALARPLAEEIIGDDLYPVVGTNGKFSASFDGLTMDGGTGFEHKTLNSELQAWFSDCDKSDRDSRLNFAGNFLPLRYQAQMEQQLLVSAAENILFMATKWHENDRLVEECHCWYTSNPELRQRIIDGWAQLEKDVAAFVPTTKATPAPIGHTPESLPALHIEVSGEVTASNLADYKTRVLAFFKGINRDLQTDQQFADAIEIVKSCQLVEDRLAAAKQHALSQTKSIDELFRDIDDISAEARRTRLELDRLVTARKAAVRSEIVARGITALSAHMAAINADLGQAYMPCTSADFAGAVKNKRTIDSLNDAVDTLLASEKIKADGIAANIRANLAALGDLAKDHEFLLHDRAVLVLKSPDDMAAVVRTRIADYQLREAQKQVTVQAAAAAMPAILASIRQPAPVSAPAQDDGKRIRLGELAECFGLAITADFLQQLGFAPVATEKNSKFYRASDFAAIRAAFVRRIEGATLAPACAVAPAGCEMRVWI